MSHISSFAAVTLLGCNLLSIFLSGIEIKLFPNVTNLSSQNIVVKNRITKLRECF